ncbi:MAG: hypothetical protein AB1659_10470 [Thermodesulfobacteriota bacterium]
MSVESPESIFEPLHRIRQVIPELYRLLFLEDEALNEWGRILDAKLLPRIHPDFPLTIAVCGGGSSGKSTLFNALVKEKISPTGGRAGMNRRVLFAIHQAHFSQEGFIEALFKPFNALPLHLKNPNLLFEPGSPCYVTGPDLPKNLVLIDTPDFDTGSRGIYINRDSAKGALETADIMIYIFTNSNYNNRDNTDFISHLLTGIGTRKSFLVYRAYPSFTDEEVREHAETVGRNIYGDGASDQILGVYRMDEDNRVASGDSFPKFRAARPNDAPFEEALNALNPINLRRELHASIMKEAVETAHRFLKTAKKSKERLFLYLNALDILQNQSVRDALRRFPSDRVIRRFTEIWLQTDPPFARVMRRTGHVVELPFRVLLKTIHLLKSQTRTIQKRPEDDFPDHIELDLLNASNKLYVSVIDPDLTISLKPDDGKALDLINRIKANEIETENPAGSNPTMVQDPKGSFMLSIPAHPRVVPGQQSLRDQGWGTIRDKILSRKEEIIRISATMDRELGRIVQGFRNSMSFMDRLRQTFSAVLNVIPATAAVTYILHTGDPVGAAGIKVKLTGLLGLKDLYALIAIPVTAGIKKADLKQLQEILEPLAKTWFDDKLNTVHTLFKNQITGPLFETGQLALTSVEIMIQNVESDLDAIR